MTDHFGGNTTYSYYDNGLLHELTDRASGLTHYEYWDNGLLKKMTYPNGTYAEYTYHAQRNWLVSLNHWKAGGTILIAGFTYEYDPTYWGKNGTRTAMTENILLPQEQSRIESTVEYTYDNVYRLTGEERTGSLSYTKSYTYDDIGNRLTKVENLTTTYYHYDYQYSGEHGQKLRDYGPWDIPGDLRNTVVSYDSAGNAISELSGGILTEYAYNYQNLMTSVKVGGNTTVQFAYDGDSLRRSATFTSGTTWFLYDGDSLIEELDAPTTLKAFYTIGAGERISRQAGTAMAYYHADALRSVKVISSPAPASVTDAYICDTWGNELARFGSTEQPYQFVGKLGYYSHYQDSTVGLLQLGLRYYDARTGRFTSRDPAYDRAEPNQYCYVRNRPGRAVDPHGLWPFDEVDCIEARRQCYKDARETFDRCCRGFLGGWPVTGAECMLVCLPAVYFGGVGYFACLVVCEVATSAATLVGATSCGAEYRMLRETCDFAYEKCMRKLAQ